MWSWFPCLFILVLLLYPNIHFTRLDLARELFNLINMTNFVNMIKIIKMIKIKMTINFIIIVQIVKKILCDKGEMHNKLYMA